MEPSKILATIILLVALVFSIWRQRKTKEEFPICLIPILGLCLVWGSDKVQEIPVAAAACGLWIIIELTTLFPEKKD